RIFATPVNTAALVFPRTAHIRALHSFPTRRSSDLLATTRPSSARRRAPVEPVASSAVSTITRNSCCTSWVAESASPKRPIASRRSEEHTSELQSLAYLVCRLLLEKKKSSSNRIRFG